MGGTGGPAVREGAKAPAGAWPRAAVRRVGGGASPVRTDGVAGRGAPGAADLGATDGEKARGTSAPGRVLCAACGVGPVAAGSPNGTRPRCATPTVSVVASTASSALAATEPPAREVAVPMHLLVSGAASRLTWYVPGVVWTTA